MSGDPGIAPEHTLVLARAAEIARSLLDSPPNTIEGRYLDLALAACCGDLFDPADVIDGVMLREQTDGGEIEAAQEHAEARVAELEAEVERLREALLDAQGFVQCDCGHPYCRRCAASRDIESALAPKSTPTPPTIHD